MERAPLQLPADPGSSALLTDLYQLTMLAAYRARQMEDTAVFEFFVRKLPDDRNFLVAGGLEQVLDFLEGLRFTREEIGWLEQTGRFQPEFLQWLARLRFEGDVHAVPEGTIVFPNEPLIRVTAPLPQAQLVETRIVSLLQFQTLIATKAARSVLAGRGKLLVDFGLRRAHGAEAGLLAARAAYLAGYDGSATVLAGMRYGIPLYGTMAHSYIQAHESETQAFEDFLRVYPENTTLLIDTYDTEAGAEKVSALAGRLRADGIKIGAVRLDSGDLGEHARKVRAILDANGCSDIRIFASGGLDERKVEQLLSDGAPIDGFGIGTSLATSEDAPAFDCAYKLEEYAGKPRRKRSEGKQTWPGRKQVFRRFDADGAPQSDTLALEHESCEGEPLLVPVMHKGRRLAPQPTLAESRERCRAAFDKLPAALKSLDRAAEPYPVEVSEGVRRLAEEADRLTQLEAG
ncbi:MAG: nicotinate phosphoribosyltransferase [Burkholderiales bacterium]